MTPKDEARERRNMHELTRRTEKWFRKNSNPMKYYKYTPETFIKLESEVLLPWLEETYGDNLIPPNFWGIEKRRERAEWLINLFEKRGYKFKIFPEVREKIFQAFGLIKTCDKCGQRIGGE